MRRLISILIAFALLCGASGALAEANWWSDIGPTKGAQATLEPTPEPTPKPEIDWAGLLRGLLPDETPEPSDDPIEDDPIEDDPTWDDPIEEPPQESLFDAGVSDMPGSATGNAVDYAKLPGWTLTRGYYIDRYCIVGMADSGERMALTTNDPLNFVPAGDAFVYYGEHAKDKYGWLIQAAGNNAPLVLPLGVMDSVFYADENLLWYFTFGKGTSVTIRTMNHEGKQKKKIGTINGRVVAMMADEKILTVNFDKNRLSLLKDGKSETIYEPDVPIESVLSAGTDIWVQHAGEFGLLEDGKLEYRLPGRIINNAGNEHAIVFLVEPYPGAAYYDVLMFNADYRACVNVGKIKAQKDANIELRSYYMTVWGPEESLDYWIPEASAWLPYGADSLARERG